MAMDPMAQSMKLRDWLNATRQDLHFGCFPREVPSVYYWIGGATGKVHEVECDMRPDTLPYGIAIQTAAVLDFLQSSMEPDWGTSC